MNYKLTPNDYRNYADSIEASEKGQTIEYRNLGEGSPWMINSPNDDLSQFGTLFLYRPKPEPVTRDWSKPEDVPGPVCWIRGVHRQGNNSHPDYRQHLIVGFSGEVSYQTISGGCQPIACSHTFSETRWENMEHSTDRKTWLPCKVTEEAK